MSESDDLVLTREAYRVWNVGSISAAIASRFMYPDIEWTTPAEVPGGGHFVGREATMAYLREWEGTMGVLNLSFTSGDHSGPRRVPRGLPGRGD